MNQCQIQADSEYGDLIRQFLLQQFPRAAASPSDKLEGVTQVLVGTLQSRLGPAPKPESLVLIREVVREAISVNEKIPVVVPFGPKKPGIGRFSVDVAELFALKSISELDAAVSDFHAPGLDVRVRVEDATGIFLEGEPAAPLVERYAADFARLAALTGAPAEVARETAAIGLKEFVARAQEVAPLFESYLRETSGEEALSDTQWGRALADAGWAGVVNPQMREHFLKKYAAIYPDEDAASHRAVLARYFAAALVRKQAGAGGARAGWRRWIQVNFLAAVPGTQDRPSTTLSRRHIPLRFGKTHVPPWRAKGFLEIGGDDHVTPAQVDWNRQGELDLVESHVTFSDGPESVRVRADLRLSR